MENTEKSWVYICSEEHGVGLCLGFNTRLTVHQAKGVIQTMQMLVAKVEQTERYIEKCQVDDETPG